MSFADDLRRFQVKLVTRNREVLLGVTDGVHESIVNGSALTGAAGQPVDTGYLKNSWQKEIAPDWQSSEIGTNVAYARPIEDGVGPHGPLTLRSAVGGFHSVKTTVANADAIVRDVVAKFGR